MKNLTDQLLFALVARIPIFAFILSASVVNALLCCSNVAIAQTPQISADRSQPSQRETSKSERGITGSTTFYYDGPALQAKVQREAAAPLVLRIQRGTQPSQYQARYIGNVSGRYDLRDWLEHTMDRQSRQPNRSWLKSCPHCPTIRGAISLMSTASSLRSAAAIA